MGGVCGERQRSQCVLEQVDPVMSRSVSHSQIIPSSELAIPHKLHGSEDGVLGGVRDRGNKGEPDRCNGDGDLELFDRVRINHAVL